MKTFNQKQKNVVFVMEKWEEKVEKKKNIDNEMSGRGRFVWIRE